MAGKMVCENGTRIEEVIVFLTNTSSGYNRDGEQFCEGKFLIIFDHPDDKDFSKKRELCCLVKNVHMRQVGNWMMALVTFPSYVLSLSGSYGGDGLPCSPHSDDGRNWLRQLWPRLHVVPPEIVDLFWNDNGHNSSGKNGPAIRDWATAHITELAKLKKVSQNAKQV